MRIPQEIVQEIVQKADIESIVGEYVNLTRKGDRLWGLSPFKTEKTPSFSITPNRNAYYCFSTHKGGSVVDFVMEMEHLSYPEALLFLANKLGIEIEYEDAAVAEKYKQKKNLLDLYKRLITALRHIYVKSDMASQARQYAQKRGLQDETLEKFQISYMPPGNWLWNFLGGKGYKADFLKESGLFSNKNSTFCLFSDRLLFPIYDISGNIIAFGGRSLLPEGLPKYINSPETSVYHKSSSLFGLFQAKDYIRKENSCFICEGYMDVLALNQAGISNAVAPLGTSFTVEQAQILKRLCGKLYLVFDNDAAGQKATERAILICEELELDCEIVQGLTEKDPADILIKDGSQALKKMLDYRLNAFDYLTARYRRQVDITKPEGMGEFIRLILPYISAIKSPVRQEGMLGLLSDLLGVSPESIQKDLSRRGASPVHVLKKNETPSKNFPVKRGREESEQLLDLKILLALSFNSSLFRDFRSSIHLEDLKHPWAQELYISLEECFREDNLEFLNLLDHITDPELKELLLRKEAEGEFSQNAKDLVENGIIRIRMRNLIGRRNTIHLQLKKLSRLPEADEKIERELLEETLIIDEAVKELRKHLDDGTAE